MSKFEKLVIGQQANLEHTLTQDDIHKFVNLTGDDNKIHLNSDYAAKTSFKKPVAHGMLGASFISTIIGTKIPGDGALWYSQSLEFLLPVRVGDRLLVKAKILKKIDKLNAIELETKIYNQKKQLVIDGVAKVKIIEQEETTKEKIKDESKSRKSVLVIGSSGGIGFDTSIELAKKGFDIILHYNSSKIKTTELKNKLLEYGVEANVLQANLLDEQSILNFIEQIERFSENLVGFVNCTTVSLASIKFADLEWSDFSDHIKINIKANFLLVKKLLPIFKRKKYGKIVLLSTQAVDTPNSEWLPYISSKSGLEGFTRSLALELAKYGICINLVSPGMTDTSLIADIPEKIRLLNAARTPLKRLASTKDIANAISFLIDDHSDFITGETLRVNGGQFMI
tara:strand:+ start:2323 stop:3513 length:1191 start_codon:yes stop_codon:yes gene_type:complete